MWFSFLRHRISSYRKSCRIWYQGDKQRFCCFSSFLSSSAVCPFIHLPSKAGPTLSFFFLFMFAKSEEQSIAPEHQKHFKILLPKIDRVLGYTHSGPFFSSCQRSRRGSLTLQMMWEDVTAGYRQGWLHSPALLPPPRKGDTVEWGPMALPVIIQANAQSHVSHAHQALKHPLSCLPLSFSRLGERCAVWMFLLRADGGQIPPNSFQDLSVFAQVSLIYSAWESFIVSFCFSSRCQLYLTLFLPLRVSYSNMLFRFLRQNYFPAMFQEEESRWETISPL